MNQIWKNYLWTLFLVITIATNILIFGNDAFADNRRAIPDQIDSVEKTVIQQPIFPSINENQDLESFLRLKSIKNSTNSPALVSVGIKETGQTTGPFTIGAQQEIPIDLKTCFNTLLINVSLRDFNRPRPVEKTISARGSGSQLDYLNYKINYEVNPISCPGALQRIQRNRRQRLPEIELQRMQRTDDE